MDIATYLKSKRNKLHARIHDFEHGDTDKIEFHRLMPLKSPTVILTGHSDNCAGRNSIDRFCLATGLKATYNQRGGKVFFSAIEPEVDFQSMVFLQIKIPGERELVEVEMAVFDDKINRDLPIKFNQGIHFGDSIGLNTSGFLKDGAIIFPRLKIPKCGSAFDFYPFPSNGQVITYLQHGLQYNYKTYFLYHMCTIHCNITHPLIFTDMMKARH